MPRQYCNSCRQETWHNPVAKKDGSPRCTYCGSPITSNPSKRDHQESIRKSQVAKAEKRMGLR